MSEPNVAGIPPEIKKRLQAEGKSKELPPLNLGGQSASEPEPGLPQVASGHVLENLVNENEEALAPTIPPPADPTQSELDKYKAIVKQQNGDIQALKKQLAEAREAAKGSTKLDDSKRFRIFLSLIEGFAARGDFSSEALLKEGGVQGAQKVLTARAQHAANLVEHIYRSTMNLPEAFRF